MARIAFLECERCRNKVSAESPQTLCAVDGGVLYVRYDMEALRRTARRGQPAEIAAAAGASAGMWRYAEVLPDVKPVTLGEGWTPMVQSRGYPGLLVKEEGANPAGTVEARGMSLAVTMAREQGWGRVAMSGDGVSASALAAYAAAAEKRAEVLVPKSVSAADFVACGLAGAEVVTVDGTVADCAEELKRRAHGADEKRLDVSDATHPMRLEGMKTVGYEIVEQLGWSYPEAIVWPGDEAGVLALEKAFAEMEALGWVSGRRARIYGVRLADGVSDEGGSAAGRLSVPVEPQAMLAAVRAWAKDEGWLLSPEGGAAVAAYGELLKSGALKEGDRVVVIDTAAGGRYAEEIASAMGMRRRDVLPASMPVGGIITPV